MDTSTRAKPAKGRPTINPSEDRLVVTLARWLSVRDIAEDLGVSMSTLYKWSSRGEPDFPRAIRLGNGDLRVRRDWYEAWLKRLGG